MDSKVSPMFKDEVVRGEFMDDHFDERLGLILCDLDDYARHQFGHGITITDIWRNSPESTHYEWRAADIRTTSGPGGCERFTSEQADYLAAFLKHRWGSLVDVKRHDDGGGDHIHININWKYTMKRFRG